MPNPPMVRAGAVALLALLVAIHAPGVAAEESCVECHRSPDHRVKNKKLFDYYVSYEKSIHSVIGLECSDCHGGDPGAEDLDDVHAGVMDPVRFDRIPEMCGSCHEEQRDSFMQSRHYKELMGDGTAPNCVTCHGAMDMDFYFTSLVRTTCTFCHNPRDGIAPDVPERAEYILSKINVIKGYRSFVRKFQTDEDAFRFLAGLAMTFRVGSADSPTAAARRLPDTEAVRALLGWIGRRESGELKSGHAAGGATRSGSRGR